MTRGNRFVTEEELALVPIPDPTETYCPLPHIQLVRSLKTISQDILNGFQLIDVRLEVAQNDNQLFGVLSFSSGTDMNLAVGFRNSLNRSLSVGLCIGSSVIVCSNLMFSPIGGGITVLKKHSKNLLVGLEDITITTLYKASYTFNQLIRDADHMKRIDLTNDQAYQLLGRLYGNGVLSPRMLPVALEQWNKPTHRDFDPRTLYSLYNASTEALKQAPVANSMESYIRNHQLLLEAI